MSLSPISQKSHDISFAVFRCAAIMTSAQLRAELESASIALSAHLDKLEIRNSELEIPATGGVVDRLERLVSLAESIGEMKTVNAVVIRRELGNLQTAIDIHIAGQTAAANKEKASGKDLDVSDMFSALENPSPVDQSVELPHQDKIPGSLAGFAVSTLPDNAPVIARPLGPKQSTSTPTASLGIKTDQPVAESVSNQSILARQEKVLRFIKDIPFCRLRNILEAMPEVSERTIRNDIQTLIDKQLVKRIGGGGPNSYFEPIESKAKNLVGSNRGESVVSV